MGYSDRTESAESKILYEWYSLPQNLDLCDANETPLSSRSEQCGEGGGIHTSKFTWTWTPLQDLTEEYCNIYIVL